MKLVDSSIRRPVTTAMIALGLVIFGIIGISKMKVDLFPEITLPMLVVGTVYPGAGPLEVESKVTQVIEQQLGTTPNLKDITSRSTEGVSVITLSFEYGTSIDAASSDVRDRLDMAQAFLPEEANKPFVFKFSTTLIPVLSAALSGNIDETTLYDLAEEVQTRLQRVAGVAAVNIGGGGRRQVQVYVDLRELAAAGITTDAFTLALRSQNLNFPVGAVSTREYRYLVRLIGQYDNLDEIRNTPIGSRGGVPVFVRNVAQVAWAPQERQSHVRMNGTRGIFISVQRRSDANTIQVAAAVKAEIARLRAALPPEVKLSVFWDNSQSIKTSVNNVVMNLGLGGILAIAILFLFLRRFRATMFVAFAIPVSIFFALLFMSLFGFSINILSMAGLAIAVGMVVDNGIVVFESIFRRREAGDDPARAASDGTDIVAMAITASTLTTLAVFLPLLMVRGVLQIFFRELSWTVIFSLSASLGVALTLIPMLASRYLKLPPPGTVERGVRGWSDRLYKGLEAWYGRAVSWCLGHRRLVVVATVVLLVASLALVPFIGSEFMPEQTSRHTNVIAEMPVGTSLDVTNDVAGRVERRVVDAWSEDLESISVQAGGNVSVWQAVFGGTRNNSAEFDIVLKPGARHSVVDVEQDMRQFAQAIPGLRIRSGRSHGYTSLIGGGAPIQVDIIGHDLETADSLTARVIAVMNEVAGLVDTKPSRQAGDPEIQFVVDREKAILYGLTPYQIGSALRTQVDGYVATQYRLRGKEYDILLRLRAEQRRDPTSVLNMTINGPAGPVLLRDVVRTRRGTSPLEIEHKNTERIVSVTANSIGSSTGQLARQLQTRLAAVPVPPGFEIRLSGSYEEMMKSFRELGLAVLIAILLVFMVMAAQFESFREPFVIMFTVPFAVIGVLWMLFATGTALSLISGIGVLVLVGVVVNNGIVYVDYVNQLRRKHGMELEAAVVEAGRVRLRPILMTALTTIFGLIPLALKLGEGSELWSPLGRAVIGGMVVSTFLTLILIPVIYTSLEHARARRRVRSGR